MHDMTAIIGIAPIIGAPHAVTGLMQEVAVTPTTSVEPIPKHSVSLLVLLLLAAVVLIVGLRWRRRGRERGGPR